MSTPKWKKFERIVAAIHVAEAKGATVTWNEDIGGRQFDVAIRFKSQFYNYLTLIECKDWSDAVPAEKVDAFVTKSRKAGANKAIMSFFGRELLDFCEKFLRTHKFTSL